MTSAVGGVVPWLLVALGGAGGAVCRFAVSTALRHQASGLGTLAVNLLGCLLIGLVLGPESQEIPVRQRALAVTGFLGGFTTFSTFGYETWIGLEKAPLTTGGHVAIQVLGGVLAVGLGIALRRAMS